MKELSRILKAVTLSWGYPPWNYQSWLENPPFWWYSPGKMVIFMGCISFREGNALDRRLRNFSRRLWHHLATPFGRSWPHRSRRNWTSEWRSHGGTLDFCTCHLIFFRSNINERTPEVSGNRKVSTSQKRPQTFLLNDHVVVNFPPRLVSCSTTWIKG